MQQDNIPVSVNFFVSVGFLLLAWKLAPAQGADGLDYVFSGLFAFVGAGMFIQAVARSERRRSLFGDGIASKILWALRPRVWMVAWALIFAGAYLYGTPHLRWQYSLSHAGSVCDYVGWSGVHRMRYGGFGCPYFAWIKPG